MRVFVTGASGHVGSAVVPELLNAGHQVVGLTRSDASAKLVADWGAEVRRGDLEDLNGLREAAAEADGVIHLAFRNDLMRAGDMENAAAADLAALRALTEPLIGTGKPLVGTSGTLMLVQLGLDRPATEEDSLPGGYRVDAENMIIALADQGVRTSVVRLPPTNHSALDTHGFISVIIASARQAGRSAYVGDGANRWPSVHTLDTAALYRLAVENAPGGSRLHSVGDEGVPFREIAETVGRRLGLPTESITAERASDHFGFLAQFVTLDNPTSSAITRRLLGWHPAHPGLIADLGEEDHYFAQ
jgi:nucleoside-diphosphate-sugar epimerase